MRAPYWSSDAFHNLTYVPTQHLLSADSLDQCDEQITPACLQALYNFKYTPAATKKNSIGIGEFLKCSR